MNQKKITRSMFRKGPLSVFNKRKRYGKNVNIKGQDKKQRPSTPDSREVNY